MAGVVSGVASEEASGAGVDEVSGAAEGVTVVEDSVVVAEDSW